MKINEARKLNNVAVIDEEKRSVDPNYEKTKKMKLKEERRKLENQEL